MSVNGLVNAPLHNPLVVVGGGEGAGLSPLPPPSYCGELQSQSALTASCELRAALWRHLAESCGGSQTALSESLGASQAAALAR